MRVDPNLLDIASKYFDKNELKRFESIVSKSREEYITERMMEEGIPSIPQLLFANMEWECTPSSQSSYSIGTLTVNSVSSENEPISVTIAVDYIVSKTISFDIPGNSVSSYQLSLADIIDVSDFSGHLKVSITATDRFKHNIIDCSETIAVSKPSTLPRVVFNSAKTNDDSDSIHLGNVVINSCDNTNPIHIYAKYGNEVIFDIQTFSSTNGKTSKEITIKRADIPNRDNIKITIVVECKNSELFRSTRYIDNTVNKKPVSVTDKKIFATVKPKSVIDIYESKSGTTDLGLIEINNQDINSEIVYVSTTINGHDIETAKIKTQPSEITTAHILCPTHLLLNDKSYFADVFISIVDSLPKTVLSKHISINVHSKYDVDLHQLPLRTAEFTNPAYDVVKFIVDNKKGPIATVMGRNYCISGYQNPNTVFFQVKSVFDAIKSIGLSYVSDTFTVENGFQRIRDPERVVSDKSGNCIELSILFSSILEAMDFEPVVIFPPGHAIVGIVLSTDVYSSSSKKPNGLDGQTITVTMSNGQHFEALFFESTLCAQQNVSFETAVDSAHDNIVKNLQTIQSRQAFSLIAHYRSRGVKPVMGYLSSNQNIKQPPGGRE